MQLLLIFFFNDTATTVFYTLSLHDALPILDNALNSYPVTYRVDGRQYVAVATNSGGIHTRTMKSAAGITLPVAGATLWVFALPE